MQKLKQILFILLMGLMVFNPVLVVAQDVPPPTTNVDIPRYEGVQDSITSFLCTPSEAADGRDLERCVNKLYRFGIAFGAIALVFFLVFAGYVYITGGESAKGKAKGIVQNALVGMGLLLGSYVILSFINPNLVVFRPIQPPIFTAENLPSCEALGLGEGCIVATGPGYSSSTGNGSIIQIAEGEIGKRGGVAMYMEDHFLKTAQASNNRGPQIDKYFSPGGTPGQPWCAYFATWVYGQAGIKTIGNLPGRGGTLTLNNYFRSRNGQSITEGTIRYFPASDVNNNTVRLLPGDLAFFDRGTEGDPFGHTAIVVGYDPTSKRISTIDGNQGQSDEVKRSTRNINTQCTGNGTCKLLGVGRIEM